MARKPNRIDLGALQDDLEAATQAVALAQQDSMDAQYKYIAALEAKDAARAALNLAAAQVVSA